jgi:hypothetical protein
MQCESKAVPEFRVPDRGSVNPSPLGKGRSLVWVNVTAQSCSVYSYF